MDVKYVNSLGEEVFLNQLPYKMILQDLFDYEHDIRESNNKIVGFESNKVKSKTVLIDVYCTKDISARENLNKLSDIFEKDVASNAPGKLYVGDWFIYCYFNGRSSQDHGDGILLSCSYTVSFDKKEWTKEVVKHFYLQNPSNQEEGLDFPTDFGIDFATDELGHEIWIVNHYSPSHFQMRIYGPCEEPRVYINEYPYQIHTSLEQGEYLIIDSRNNTVEKYSGKGVKEDIYNSRDFEHSVFEKIPSGQLSINWEGTFGFDITLYIERSEPKW